MATATACITALDHLGAAKTVVKDLVANNSGGAAGALEALQVLPGMVASLPSVMRASSKAKDLLISVLTSTTICELLLDPTLLSAREAAQLQHKLLKNREAVHMQREHGELGADAPPMDTNSVGRRTGSFQRRVKSWGRKGRGTSAEEVRVASSQASRRRTYTNLPAHLLLCLIWQAAAPRELPVLGVLFSAPLACVDPTGPLPVWTREPPRHCPERP